MAGMASPPQVTARTSSTCGCALSSEPLAPMLYSHDRLVPSHERDPRSAGRVPPPVLRDCRRAVLWALAKCRGTTARASAHDSPQRRAPKTHTLAPVAVQRRQRHDVADAHFRGRQLARWFQHWESVSTDRWIAKRLVQLHTRERHRRLASRGVTQWREAVSERRRARLAMVLLAWRRVADGTHCTNN